MPVTSTGMTILADGYYRNAQPDSLYRTAVDVFWLSTCSPAAEEHVDPRDKPAGDDSGTRFL